MAGNSSKEGNDIVLGDGGQGWVTMPEHVMTIKVEKGVVVLKEVDGE